MTGHTGELFRTMRRNHVSIPGFLADYAFFVHGLIELHRGQVGSDKADRYLQLAERYTDAAIGRFAVERGGYFDTREDQGDLFVRLRSTHDGVIPSGNSQMVHNLLDLYELTGKAKYADRAMHDLRSFGQLLDRRGAALVHMQHALLRALEQMPEHFDDDVTATQGHDHTASAPPVTIGVAPHQLDLTDGEAEFDVTLHIEPGYHLNASNVEKSSLVPTELILRGARGLSLEVEYPEGEHVQLPSTDEPIPIYQDEVVIHITLRRGATVNSPSTPRLMLRYQACTDTACLAPETVELPVAIVGLNS